MATYSKEVLSGGAADGTGIKSIKQVAFNHIYWAASVMAEST